MKELPTLGIPLILYNLIFFIESLDIKLEDDVFRVSLISKAIFKFTVSDALISLGIILLTVEIFKATRHSASTLVDHILSMGVFIIFLIEFITYKPAGTATFLILTMMTLVDVIVGFSVTISTASRDLTVSS